MRANHVDPFLGKEDRGESGEREEKRRKGRNVFGALDREAVSFTSLSLSGRKREENAIFEDSVPSMPIQFNRKKNPTRAMTRAHCDQQWRKVHEDQWRESCQRRRLLAPIFA
ncbi:hypothetical protein OIU74_025962 [Salix koriyanagi]|uniref:Uncharacterized protein n=1 Tax=Salix koriyanagi TaxID=2511006 RepID=A0A9Q0W2V6_9ROSI|nr:hypothetical protein OIU74_025962 [Salix koriyanagi]